jgi:hypothetical protein
VVHVVTLSCREVKALSREVPHAVATYISVACRIERKSHPEFLRHLVDDTRGEPLKKIEQRADGNETLIQGVLLCIRVGNCFCYASFTVECSYIRDIQACEKLPANRNFTLLWFVVNMLPSGKQG